MKRLVMFMVPMLATLLAVGLGLALFRSRTADLGPRITAAKTALAKSFEEVTQAVEEALE